MKQKLFICDSCFDLHKFSKLLKADHPFDKTQTIFGCPSCKSVAGFSQICDAPRCKEISTCGTPSKNGYRRVCGNHYRELQDSRSLRK